MLKGIIEMIQELRESVTQGATVAEEKIRPFISKAE